MLTMPSISREYIYVSGVHVFRDGEPVTGAKLQTLQAQFALVPQNTTPRSRDWLPGQWLESSRRGAPTAAILIGEGTVAPVTPGVYTVWLRVVGAVMAPTRPVGDLTVT